MTAATVLAITLATIAILAYISDRLPTPPLEIRYTAETGLDPRRAHDDDAALDLRSAENVTILPGCRKKISTSVHLELPTGHAAIIKGRSGLATNHGANPLGGVIDSGYRGEIFITLHNTDNANPININRGDRIAQMLITEVPSTTLTKIKQVNPDTSRGTNGHGSTGK